MSKRKSVKREMATALVTDTNQGANDMALLDDLLKSVGADDTPAAAQPDPATDEIIVGEQPEDLLIEAAANALEIQEFYAERDEAADTQEQPAADQPTVDTEAAKPKRKVKGEKAPKEPKTPKEPKADSAPRVTYHGHSKSAVLDNRLGGQTASFLVLEKSDANLDATALAAKQAAIKDELDNNVAKKVAEKCVMLFKDLHAGRPISNEVMKRAFETLARDGFLTSGDKGNMQGALADKYSIGTARSQANQMFALLPFLKVTLREKGRMVPNPDSTILEMVLSAHGLTLKQAA